MITANDLRNGSKMRLTLALDMASGSYQNHYRSETYPRFAVVREGGRRDKDGKQQHSVAYYVDSIECDTIADVVNMLNAEPHPQRTDLTRHESEK
jgi:hypothetical protein